MVITRSITKLVVDHHSRLLGKYFRNMAAKKKAAKKKVAKKVAKKKVAKKATKKVAKKKKK